MAGTFDTTFETEIILKLPELNHSAEVYAKCHLTDKILNWDLILGRDILHELGIVFNFEKQTNYLARSFNFNETTKLHSKRNLCYQKKVPS